MPSPEISPTANVAAIRLGSTIIGTDFIIGAIPEPASFIRNETAAVSVESSTCNVSHEQHNISSSQGNSVVSFAEVANVTVIINTRVSTNATIITGAGDEIIVPEFAKVAVIVLPGSLIPTGNGISNTGIRIKTSNPSSVQAIVNSTIPNQSEGTLVFPVGTLGTRYFINGASAVNQAFSVVAANDATNVTLRFPNGTISSFSLNALQSLSFSGHELIRTIVELSQSGAVFSGSNCASGPAGEHETHETCGYLWEQSTRQENFGYGFIFVNPNPTQNHTANTGLRLVSKEAFHVTVNISGTGSFELAPKGDSYIFFRATTNLTHEIVANGQIDIEVVTGSLGQTNHLSQFSLIPNMQFVDQAFFFITPGLSSQLIIVALTSDITNPSSSLKFDDQPFDLSQFQPTANPKYSVAIINDFSGAFVMDSTFGVAGYLFEFDENNTLNSGSIIGRNL